MILAPAVGGKYAEKVGACSHAPRCKTSTREHYPNTTKTLADTAMFPAHTMLK